MSSRINASLFLIILLPIILIIYVFIKVLSAGPFLFKQKRVGKDKKVFTIYKIRTMIYGAEAMQFKYKHLNQAHGPTFKIYDDPRFTKVGKYLARFGLDELPQLINIIKGEMAFVGPRPLPVAEAKKVPKKYDTRFSVLPGLTSLWVVKGGHKLSFKRWMELDLVYVQKKSLWLDIQIIAQTIWLLVKAFIDTITLHKDVS